MSSCRKCKNRVIGYMFTICPWIWLKNFTRWSSSKVKVLTGKISQGKLPEENAKIARLLFVDRSRGEASSKSNLSRRELRDKRSFWVKRSTNTDCVHHSSIKENQITKFVRVVPKVFVEESKFAGKGFTEFARVIPQVFVQRTTFSGREFRKENVRTVVTFSF